LLPLKGITVATRRGCYRLGHVSNTNPGGQFNLSTRAFGDFAVQEEFCIAAIKQAMTAMCDTTSDENCFMARLLYSHVMGCFEKD